MQALHGGLAPTACVICIVESTNLLRLYPSCRFSVEVNALQKQRGVAATLKIFIDYGINYVIIFSIVGRCAVLLMHYEH